MENIFENSHFGKRYSTRNGEIALYIEPLHDHHILAVSGYEGAIIAYTDKGEVVEGEEHEYDIIEELEE